MITVTSVLKHIFQCYSFVTRLKKQCFANRDNTARYGLILFIVLHVSVWTLAPAFLRLNLPMDAMEGFTWGMHLDWGYDKNPFLNAFLTRVALLLDGQSGWMVYLFSQLSVGICFGCVWQLGAAFMPRIYALLAVLLLEGLQYYNFHAIDFNDNTLELSLWALVILFFWRAISSRKLLDWLCVGGFAGIGLMAKYYTVILLLPLFIFMLRERVARRAFLTLGPYVAMVVMALVSLPHVIWLFFHNFITVRYAFARTDAPSSLLNHVYFPVMFLWQQFEVLLPSLILMLPFCIGKATPVMATVRPLNRYKMRFLVYTGVGPLLLTVLLSALTGMKLRAGWGQPLLSLSGVLFFATFRPVMTLNRLRMFLGLFCVLFVALVSGYVIAMLRADKPSSAFFPGQPMSESVSMQWHGLYHRPLRYVVGPRWLAGNVAFYAKSIKGVYMEGNPHVSPWINEACLRKEGAVFIWESDNTTFEQAMRERFKSLGAAYPLSYAYRRHGDYLPHVSVMVAFLPPIGLIDPNSIEVLDSGLQAG